MQFKALLFLCILSVSLFVSISAGGGGGEKEHVKIIIPVHHKTIKHTHTIYKTIHHKDDDGGDDLGILIASHGGDGGGGGFGGFGKWY